MYQHTASLTPLGKAMLDLETSSLGYDRRPGRKGEYIRQTLGLSETRYYQLLHRLIQRPEALVYAPNTVNRLHRLVEARTARRQAGERALAIAAEQRRIERIRRAV